MRRGNARGFTLIELLVSISILSIIIGALTTAMITFLQNGRYTTERDDHSGGASVFNSYLNRDVASASTYSSSTTPCRGTGTALFTLAWTEWTATAADPSPAPNGGDFSVSYLVAADVDAVGGADRFQLLRRSCPDDGSQDVVLLRNLHPQTPSAPNTVVTRPTSVAATSTCPGGALTITLHSYLDDAAAQSFSFSGCLQGRSR